MLYFGTNITAPADLLQPIPVAGVYQALRHPKPQIRQLVDQLRIMQTMDKNSYRLQKKRLPYLVCAAFKPAVRRRENFLHIGYFFVDLDGLSPHFDKQVLWKKLTTDPQLVLLFTSPGGDGLKLLYKLAEKCTDSGMFSAFYKLFVAGLAAKYHLHAVVDTSTSDVTRACFISYDENAYYNADAHPVAMQAYLNTQEADVFLAHAAEANTAWKEVKEVQKENPQPVRAAGPAADALAAIRQKLNPNFRKPVPKEYYVPPEVDAYLERVEQLLPRFHLQLLEKAPIQYGRKLKIATTGAWAEINLFYGKRGYTFVKTTKTGSNAELAGLCVQVLEQLLFGGAALESA